MKCTYRDSEVSLITLGMLVSLTMTEISVEEFGKDIIRKYEIVLDFCNIILSLFKNN